MSTHNICFYEDLTKIIIQLSSNMHLIYSSDDGKLSFTGPECCSKVTDSECRNACMQVCMEYCIRPFKARSTQLRRAINNVRCEGRNVMNKTQRLLL